MRWLLLILFLIPSIGYSQVFNLQYSYKEVCSDVLQRVVLEIDINSNTTFAFFGYSQTFTPQQVSQNEHIDWLGSIYRKWREYYPCAEITELVSTNVKNSSETGDIDISQPIVILASDLSYYNGNIVGLTGGYNKSNLLTNTSNGFMLNMSSNINGNIGYYKLTPLNSTTKTMVNANLMVLQNDVIANTSVGILGNVGVFGSYFTLHSVTFGSLNGYPFQDNSLIVGHTKSFVNNKTLKLSTNLVISYTYRRKVFTLDYWFEDYMTIKPFVNVGYKLTDTFGMNLTYTNSLKTNMNTSDRWGLLLGGRVLF